MKQIKSVTIITTQGVNAYRVGSKISGIDCFVVDKITAEGLKINGAPYDHFCLYDKDGKLRATIYCLAPCEVEYFV